MKMLTAKQNQKFPFHFFFRFAAEGWGGGGARKCKEIFGFCTRESASVSEARITPSSGFNSKYIRTSFNTHRQNSESEETDKAGSRRRRDTNAFPPAESRIQKGFPRSAWLVVCQYNSMNNQTKKFFIYTRKSTDDKDRQVRSISDQLSELKDLALKEQLEVVDVFVEKQTAKIPGRPVFGEMIERMEKGEASGILAWHPDRLARNSVDGGKVIYLVDTGVISEMKFPTFWFDPTPQGKFMLSIAFSQSKYYVDNLSENIKRGHRNKVKEGIWPQMSPLGYINVGGKIVVDKNIAPLIKKTFEAYSSGSFTLRELHDKFNGLGLKRKSGKELAVSNYQKLLKNPIYTGLMRYNEEIFEGKHEPIISKKLFDSVQEVMMRKSKPKSRGLKPFLYRGFFRCGECGCFITTETQKGHNYLRCTKRKNPCSQKYTREEIITSEIQKEIKKVSLPDDWAKWMLAENEKDKLLEAQSSTLSADKTKADISHLDSKIEKLMNAYLENALSLEEYRDVKNKLGERKTASQREIIGF
jgi:site-specific DNA recombinase